MYHMMLNVLPSHFLHYQSVHGIQLWYIYYTLCIMLLLVSDFKMASARPTSVCDLLHHHITTGVVCDPCSGKEHHVSSVCYLVSTDTEQAPLPHNLIGSCVLIKWEQFRYTVHSIQWNLANLDPWNQDTSIFRTLIVVPNAVFAC